MPTTTPNIDPPIPGIEIPGYEDGRLTLPDDYSFKNWVSIGSKLNSVETSMPWLIGDWLVYGENNYGERFAQYADATGRKPRTLMIYKRVAQTFSPDRRYPNIAFNSYVRITWLKRDEQDAVLVKCRDDGWKFPQVVAYCKALREAKKAKGETLRGPVAREFRRCDECGLTPAELREKLKHRDDPDHHTDTEPMVPETVPEGVENE